MQFYFLLILALVSLFFLWFGYYSNKKIYIIFSSIIGMILGILIMANGIIVPNGSNINGTVDKNAFAKFLLPTGDANQLLTTDGNNIYWTDLNTDINLISTNYWTKSGNNLKYNDGNVNIGGNIFNHLFTVFGDANITSLLYTPKIAYNEEIYIEMNDENIYIG